MVLVVVAVSMTTAHLPAVAELKLLMVSSIPGLLNMETLVEQPMVQFRLDRAVVELEVLAVQQFKLLHLESVEMVELESLTRSPEQRDGLPPVVVVDLETTTRESVVPVLAAMVELVMQMVARQEDRQAVPTEQVRVVVVAVL